jgi:hypothetical protein
VQEQRPRIELDSSAIRTGPTSTSKRAWYRIGDCSVHLIVPKADQHPAFRKDDLDHNVVEISAAAGD